MSARVCRPFGSVGKRQAERCSAKIHCLLSVCTNRTLRANLWGCKTYGKEAKNPPVMPRQLHICTVGLMGLSDARRDLYWEGAVEGQTLMVFES